MALIEHVTPACPECGEPSMVWIPEEGFNLWQSGMHVQMAFPELGTNERELLLTGFHPECWDRVFPPEEEEDELGAYGWWQGDDSPDYYDPEDYYDLDHEYDAYC